MRFLVCSLLLLAATGCGSSGPSEPAAITPDIEAQQKKAQEKADAEEGRSKPAR